MSASSTDSPDPRDHPTRPSTSGPSSPTPLTSVPIILTGRAFVVLQSWATAQNMDGERRAKLLSRTGATPEEAHRPIPGDMRLTTQLDAAARVHNGRAPLCHGVVNGVVFDGLVWQRFDLTGFTGSLNFSTPEELEGVLVWLRRMAANAEGKTCSVRVTESATSYRLDANDPPRA